MRLDIQFIDRVGIFQEILLVFARHRLNIVAVEVDALDIFVDAPALMAQDLPALRSELLRVPGVREISNVDILPGARRRLYLNALVAAMVDPILAVDASARVIVANAAASTVAAVADAELTGMTVGTLFGDAALQAELVEQRFALPPREVMLRGTPFLVEARPLMDSVGEPAAGGLLTLHAPARIGERLHAIQHAQDGSFDTMLGTSAPMRILKARAQRAAAVDAALLIRGETGTGKELVALACHASSPRARAPFLALNCAALPENLAESELFGYAPGTFTGGQRGGKPGLLELANRGTIFLDEVGEMSPYLQAKLLRFLNDGSFRRVGGEREQRVDVRIVSATHRDLEQMVAQGRFREDLFYRLNVLALAVPPLRERADDVPLLARLFIDRAAKQARRSPCRLTAAANELLLAHPWPGNVRQLQNVIFRAVVMSDKPLLDAEDLDLAESSVRRAGASPAPEVTSWEEARASFEKELLERLYRQHPSSRKLAQVLKISHTMVADKLRKYGIGYAR